MKIRQGFVSNSSSSSFCILGVTLDEIEGEVSLNKWEDPEIEGLEGVPGIEEYDEEYLIGLYPMYIDDNETISQAKDRIVALAQKAGCTIKKKDITWHIDGGIRG